MIVKKDLDTVSEEGYTKPMTIRLFHHWLKELGLSYSAVARRCGCTRQAVHQWVNSGSPRIDTLANAVTIGLGRTMREFYSADLTDGDTGDDNGDVLL